MIVNRISRNYLHLSLMMGLIVVGFSVLKANAQTNSSEVTCNVSEGVPVVAKSRANSSHIRKNTAQQYKRIYSQPKVHLYPAAIVRLQGKAFLVERSGQNLTEQKMLYQGGELQLGDVVQTGNQSFISLRLGDGTLSMLPSNSRIQLSQSSNSVGRFILQAGTVQNKVIKKPRARSNTFEIQTQGSMIGVRGTEFSVRGTEQGTSVVTLAVEEGKVWVRPRNSCVAPTIVDAGSGALIGLSTRKVPLLDAPNLKNADVAQPNEQLHFELKPVSGAVSYRAQVLRDVNTLETLAEYYNREPDLTFDIPDLPNGYYYVKLTAFDDLGIESLSKTYLFLRNRNTRVE